MYHMIRYNLLTYKLLWQGKILGPFGPFIFYVMNSYNNIFNVRKVTSSNKSHYSIKIGFLSNGNPSSNKSHYL